MISDEQIKALAVARGFKLTNETGDDLKPYVYEFARDLIALAQQIKPLEFVECSIQYRDLPVAYLKAETPLGNYTIHKYKYFFAANYFYSGPGNGGKSVAAEATAIEAANEDYRKRALSNLVHGGTNG